MSLLSTDITKVKRLSLREVTLPAPEQRVELITPIQVDRPPTYEEITYSKLVAINPLLEELVDSLGLVSIETGERIKKVELREDITSPPEPEIKPKEIDKTKLIALAQKLIKREKSYSKEEIIAKIVEATNVNQERAERGFNLMLQAVCIRITPGGRYYLTGSTPF